MRTSFIALFGLVATAMALPGTLESRNFPKPKPFKCSTGTAQCCDVDVLGVADLDCETPSKTLFSVGDFKKFCAAKGKIDMCCILPILDQGILCTAPVGK